MKYCPLSAPAFVLCISKAYIHVYFKLYLNNFAYLICILRSTFFFLVLKTTNPNAEECK